MNRTGFIIAIAAAFFAGCGMGVLGSAVLTHVMHNVTDRVHSHARHGEPRHRHEMMLEPGPEELVPHLSRLLELDDRQRAQVEEILLRARAEHDVTRDSMHAAIERVLTPEQRIRWQEIESRFPRGRHGRSAPRPGGDRP